ncbi:MAG: NAD(P)-dependent alcohol dehydrogenase [Thermoplasmata archaeon]|nr:MAG: NAD(P)-dependent alcohol dehydrogenase [Thermoplasmata archaeon]
MKAVVTTRYGPPDVLEFRELPRPVPKAGQVLIRTAAATVTKGDCEFRALDLPLSLRLMIRLFFGLRRPRRKVLGQEISGEIVQVGKEVTSYKVGDQVFGSTGASFGAWAEYACLPEKAVMTTLPSNMTFEEAATVPLGGLESLHFLGEGNIREGSMVLINGSGGSIGTYGIQIAKSMGAEVTAVDAGTKLDMMRSIGADHVIDYQEEDFTENGVKYDTIFDVVGEAPFPKLLDSLSQGGTFLIANPKRAHKGSGRRLARRTGKRVVSAYTVQRTEDLVHLKGLIEEDKIRSVIDRRYPLEQVPDAHRYVETGQKQGNVVINVWDGTETGGGP